jgi:hypothetical protein
MTPVPLLRWYSPFKTVSVISDKCRTYDKLYFVSCLFMTFHFSDWHYGGETDIWLQSCQVADHPSFISDICIANLSVSTRFWNDLASWFMGVIGYLRTACQWKDRIDGYGGKEILVGRSHGKRPLWNVGVDGRIILQICFIQTTHEVFNLILLA